MPKNNILKFKSDTIRNEGDTARRNDEEDAKTYVVSKMRNDRPAFQIGEDNKRKSLETNK